MPAIIDKHKCTGCGHCIYVCLVEAISIEKDKAVVNIDTCIDCGACVNECPQQAIQLD